MCVDLFSNINGELIVGSRRGTIRTLGMILFIGALHRWRDIYAAGFGRFSEFPDPGRRWERRPRIFIVFAGIYQDKFLLQSSYYVHLTVELRLKFTVVRLELFNLSEHDGSITQLIN